jgi:hypothetical protein
MLLIDTAEYHPYAACLMYRACRDGRQVRENLAAVRGTDECRRVANEIHEALMEQKPGSAEAGRLASVEEGALLCVVALVKPR